MIERVLSGGQTGVDRAALDAALSLGLNCGGWCPRGRRAEDGTIPDFYPLKGTPDRDYVQRTEWNVRDSDATLILCHGKPSGGTAMTVQFAKAAGKPVYLADLEAVVDEQGIRRWLDEAGSHTQHCRLPGKPASRYLSSGVYAIAESFSSLGGTEKSRGIR